MANSITSFTDAQIMKALLQHNFTDIDREFIDDVITSIKPGAFYQAQNLDKVSMPAATVVGARAFAETSLNTLELSWRNLTSIGVLAFQNGWSCLPENLVLQNLVELGSGAFAGSSSAKNTRLKTVSLPLWTGTAPSSAGFSGGSIGTFEYCSGLTSVSAPELMSLTMYMFRGCTSLEEITLPKVQTLSGSIFYGCTGLRKVDLGGQITAISSVFLPTGTSALETLILRGVTTVPSLGSNAFNNTKVASGTAYVYVPSSLLQLFTVATNWSKYAAQIRAIEEYPDICGS